MISDIAGNRRILKQIARYDRLLSGQKLNATEARDLRALVRVFDLEVDPGEGLTTLWLRLRPLIEDAGAGCGPMRRPGRFASSALLASPDARSKVARSATVTAITGWWPAT